VTAKTATRIRLRTNTSLGAKKRPPVADQKNRHPVRVTPVISDAVQKTQLPTTNTRPVRVTPVISDAVQKTQQPTTNTRPV
jgi:hypothetical protein